MIVINYEFVLLLLLGNQTYQEYFKNPLDSRILPLLLANSATFPLKAYLLLPLCFPSYLVVIQIY